MSCRVLIDKVTSFHKGVAYVEFANNEEAKNAIKYMDGGKVVTITKESAKERLLLLLKREQMRDRYIY